MRRKQFLALLLTGAMTVGMTPAAAFAAEEPLTIEGEAALSVEEEPAAEEPAENTETPDEPDVTPETPQEPDVTPDAPAETPTPEAPVETPTPEAPVETPTPEAPTGAPVEEQEQDIPQINAEEATPTPTPEVKENEIKIGETVYNSLAEAVAAATAETVDSTLGATKIVIGGTITVDSTINVAAGQSVMIVPGTAQAEIVRGPEFKGDMFTVNDGGILYLSGSQILGTDGAETNGSLTVNGAQADTAVVSDGSIAVVGAGSVFSIDTGATLTGNVTTANGGAIRNEGGSVTLMGGTITGCQAAEGGAIYSNTSVNVRGSLNVSGNTKLDGVTASNIALTAGAGLVAAGQLTEGSVIGVSVQDAVPGTPVISILDSAAEAVKIADVLPFVTYEAEGFTLDENGMVAEEAPEVSPTPTPEEVPLKLTGVSMEWTGENSAKVVCISNKDGWYYADWVTRGSKAPKFDVSKPGVEVQADRKFTIYLSDLDPNKEIDVYVLVKDKEDNLSKKQLFQLDENSRPKPTPTPHTPVIPKVTESTVRGLENALEFYPGVFYEFTVTGAGTKNNNPGLGDVKWVPLYWSMSTNPADKDKHASWKIGATNGIKDAATYDLYIFFQKWEYDGSNWKATDTIESAGYKFRSKAIVIATSTPTPTVPGDNGYYGESGSDYNDPSDPDYYDDDTEDTGNTTADAVATADESPVGTMTMLAMASLLAGGYILVRKRKKEF